MSREQLAAYGAAETVSSGPLGLPRDNRNHRKKARLLHEWTAADPGDRVLEVGCGDGLHAAAHAARFDLTAVDLSPSLARTTRERVPEAGVLQADATSLPLAADSVTAVVGAAILHHLPDAEAALREWCRVAAESVTVIEPNYLFPLAFVSAHTEPAERHKTQCAPWRLRQTLAALDADTRLTPAVYTPPWPERLAATYDRLDRLCGRLPGLRWASQLLVIHAEP